MIGSGIAKAVTLAVRALGGTVVVAGRDREALAAAYDDAVVFALTGTLMTGVSIGIDGGESLV